MMDEVASEKNITAGEGELRNVPRAAQHELHIAVLRWSRMLDCLRNTIVNDESPKEHTRAGER